MTKGTYDPNSPKIGFADWNLSTLQGVAGELLNEAFKEALDIATSEYEVNACFKTKANQLHIEVGLPIGPAEYDDPTWTFPVDQMIAEVIELEDSEDYIGKVRDELRRLADLLDARLEQP
jgi:hypothetical protein